MRKNGATEQQTAQPEFWTDATKAENVMKQVRALKGWTVGYENADAIIGDLDTLYEFYEAGEVTEEEVTDYLYGKHSVFTAIEKERQINRIWVLSKLRHHPAFFTLIDQAKANGC